MAGLDPSGAVATSSGTAGLVAALKARAPSPGLCLMPAWTFAATPAAAVMAGLTPYFLDVDPESWALDPAQVVEQAKTLAPAAILAVIPFGSPFDAEAWAMVERHSGAPVVIDAAAAFDALTSDAGPVGAVPTIVSLHATKAVGCGEGGVVLSRDRDLAARVRRLTNFGFGEERLAVEQGFNGKMSEYHAAVGLAALDAWPERRGEWCAVKQRLRAGLAGLDGLALGPDARTDVAVSTFNVLTDQTAEALKLRLAAEGVMTLRWWSVGCADHPAFESCPRGPLPITRHLADHVLGLPLFPDMGADEAARVIGAVSKTLAGDGVTAARRA